MNKQIIKVSDMQRFAAECFDRPEESEKATRILKGILDARSPRISDISHAMEGSSEANYKTIQRFLDSSDPKQALQRLYWEETPYVIGDPTDIERYQARKTKYVGKLKDGKTPGFQVLPLAFPYRGRAVPFTFITYSSKTIEDECSSRNLQHYRIIAELVESLAGKPLVLDREFSYEKLFENMVREGLSFVIRLNMGNRATITDEEGRKVTLSICPGERIFLRGVYYKGKVRVNLAGQWDRGLREPLWVISDLEPEEAMAIYQDRMKIEQSFRDLKSLLGLDKIMNKGRERMEKMVAMMLLAYSIALLIGEEIRDRVYKGRKWKLYSGVFVLLKQRVQLARETITDIINHAYSFFSGMVQGDVRTHV
ncbi:transposase [Dehalococcoidia bacterium]|nr:transposase [Dehalococcoidia bacterium]